MKKPDITKLNSNIKYIIVVSNHGKDFYFHEPSGFFIKDISSATVCDTYEKAERLLEVAKEYLHEGCTLEIQRVRATFTLQNEEKLINHENRKTAKLA